MIRRRSQFALDVAGTNEPVLPREPEHESLDVFQALARPGPCDAVVLVCGELAASTKDRVGGAQRLPRNANLRTQVLVACCRCLLMGRAAIVLRRCHDRGEAGAGVGWRWLCAFG